MKNNPEEQAQMRFDIQTVSEANQREHWTVKAKRKKQQQRDFAMLWRAGGMDKPELPPHPTPATITLTRYSCKMLDADNLAGAFKHVQDQLARELRIDDGNPLYKWQYTQEQTAKREHYFTVEITNDRS